MSARGGGALTGFVDIILELTRFGKMMSDSKRRIVQSLSRRGETPEELAFEWSPTTGEFTHVTDPSTAEFAASWLKIEQMLQDRKSACTFRDLELEWSSQEGKPSRATLYRWLQRAHIDGLVQRTGHGTTADPWRYRLPGEEKYDEDLLEELEEMIPLNQRMTFRT